MEKILARLERTDRESLLRRAIHRFVDSDNCLVDAGYVDA